MVQLNQKDQVEQITVSDPNRELSILVLYLSKKFDVSAENYRSEWISDPGYTRVIVNLPKLGYSGKSVVIR